MSNNGYVILCSDGSVYVGETGKSVEERFHEHKVGYKSRLSNTTTPVRLIETKRCKDRQDALRWERETAAKYRRMGYHVRGGH